MQISPNIPKSVSKSNINTLHNITIEYPAFNTLILEYSTNITEKKPPIRSKEFTITTKDKSYAFNKN